MSNKLAQAKKEYEECRRDGQPCMNIATRNNPCRRKVEQSRRLIIIMHAQQQACKESGRLHGRMHEIL